VINIIVALTLMLTNQGYSQQEVVCTMNLIKIESNFHLHSKNSKSGAYGLFQLMNVKTKLSLNQQVARFNRYVEHRYSGSVCKALDHQYKFHWY
jgi:hypothetical protein